jgi:hypothetical protein
VLRGQVLLFISDHRFRKVEANLWRRQLHHILLILVDIEGISDWVLVLSCDRRRRKRTIAQQALSVLQPHRSLHQIVFIVGLNACACRSRLRAVLDELPSRCSR